MTFVIETLILGLIFSFLALAVLISFRIFSFADITTDGSLTLGAATTTLLLIRGVDPVLATLMGMVGGAAGGWLTAVLYTRAGISGFLAGILVVPILYALSFALMGDEPVFLEGVKNADFEKGEKYFFGSTDQYRLLIELGSLVAATVLLLYWFFRTSLGIAIRATGDNGPMVRGYGIEVGIMTILGLAMANGLAGLAGGLLVQYYGSFHFQMGVGMIAWGLASVMFGEQLLPGKRILRMLIATVVGALLFRFLHSTVLSLGIHPAGMKFITSCFVLGLLLMPRLRSHLAKEREVQQHA